MFLLDVVTERADFDINVTPDKRTVMLTREAALLTALQGALEDVWDASKWQFTQSLAATQAAKATAKADGCAFGSASIAASQACVMRCFAMSSAMLEQDMLPCAVLPISTTRMQG